MTPKEDKDLLFDDGIFSADPEWLHNCAKDIIKELHIDYNVLKMYDIARIIKKYVNENT